MSQLWIEKIDWKKEETWQHGLESLEYSRKSKKVLDRKDISRSTIRVLVIL